MIKTMRLFNGFILLIIFILFSGCENREGGTFIFGRQVVLLSQEDINNIKERDTPTIVRIHSLGDSIEMTVDSVIFKVTERTSLKFSFPNNFEGSSKVWVKSGSIQLRELLDKIEIATNTIASEADQNVYISLRYKARMCGQVVDESKNKIADVIIYNPSCSCSTQTDGDGGFCIRIQNESDSLFFDYKGYMPLKIPAPKEQPWDWTITLKKESKNI